MKVKKNKLKQSILGLEEKYKLRIVMITLFFLLGACQTTSDKSPMKVVVLPAYLQSHFDECISDNGTLEIEGSQKSKFNFSGEVDWQVGQKHDFAFEVVNSVGQGLWKVERKGDALDVDGLYATELPQLEIDNETQKLLIGRYFSGFLIHEIPCLFKSRLPAAWQGRIVKSQTQTKATVLEVNDPFRSIQITIKKTKDTNLSKVCSRIKWSHFLGFSKQEVFWCYEKLKSKKVRYNASFNFNSDVRMKWTSANE